jgi:hypothetical protein
VTASTQLRPTHAADSFSRTGDQNLSPWPELRTQASVPDISPPSLWSTVLRI